MNVVFALLFCLAVSPPVLRRLTERLRLYRIAWSYWTEVQDFIVLSLSILILFLGMGAISMVPVIGQFIGFPWIRGFLARWEGRDSALGICGLLFHLTWLVAITLALCKCCTRISTPLKRTDTGRRALALASFYCACVSFELLPFCFGLDRSLDMISLISTMGAVTVSVLVLVWLDLRIRAKGSQFPLFQIGESLLVAILVGALLERGSIHTAPLVYAKTFRELLGSIPGVCAILATVIVGVRVLAEFRPGTRGGQISAPNSAIVLRQQSGVPQQRSEVRPRVLGSAKTIPPRRFTGAVAHVISVKGSCEGQRFDIESGGATIGRGGGNAIVLRGDHKISSTHAAIRGRPNGSFYVTDLGSTNGVFVNGSQVHSHELNSGDEIRLGNTLLRFVC
jgi:hypothetical protein